MRPRVLLAATSCWFSTARLAIALARAECDVEINCPFGHPVTHRRAGSKIHPYLFFAPLRSIASAIAAARPDAIIPCDDLARSHMVRLYGRLGRGGASAEAERTVLRNSLGEASMMSVPNGRSELMALAHQLGVRAPATAPVHRREDLTKWFVENPLPVVLKTDGSFGGRGVRIADSLVDADHAWRALRTPPSAGRAIKRAIVNRDTSYVVPWLRRTRPVVNAQRFVSGRDANCTVACWKGTMLACITAVVLETVDSLGPASVVRVIDNQEMSDAAAAIVSRLKLSGLIGFDFILDEPTGAAYLIEMNPRATQICHLPLGMDRDLLRPLRAVLAGEPLLRPAVPVTENDVIALFPQEWLRDSQSAFLTTAYHDVPWEEPDLLRRCLTETIEFRAWCRLSAAARATRAWLADAKRKGLGRPDGRRAAIENRTGHADVGRD